MCCSCLVLVWTLDISGCVTKGLRSNLVQKCLERCNVAIGVDERKSATSAKQC